MSARLPTAAAVCAVSLLLSARVVEACPFCVALEPTLCQRRQSAAATLLGEVERASAGGSVQLRVHKVISGGDRIRPQESLEIALDPAPRAGMLVVVFGNGPAESEPSKLAWQAVAVNEASYAYFARAPGLKMPPEARLRYFAPFLEHADPLVAQDAYLEFGHATFDDVRRVADALPLEKMRDWLTQPGVRPERKGFYGLGVALVSDERQKRASADVLRRLILAPEDDFRAGFDGILAGYLLLSGEQGLALVEERYLANSAARDGDVRHALLALRFYHEFGRDIPHERLCQALRRVLDRPEFAAAAITDLARWGDWQIVGRVSGLYAQGKFDELAISRAIVGYLVNCPRREGAEALRRLRTQDPQGVAAAEAWLEGTAGANTGQ